MIVSKINIDIKYINLINKMIFDDVLLINIFDNGICITQNINNISNLSIYIDKKYLNNHNISTENSNGYIVAISDNKTQYRSIYDQAVTSYRNRDNFMTFIFVNHFVSMLDALIVSKLSSNRTAMMIDYDQRMNFFQAKLSIKLK